METLSTGITSGFLILFGAIQFCIYLKYATSIAEMVQAAPRSRLYAFQRFLLIFVPMLASVRCMLLAYFYKEPALYGYMVSCISYLRLLLLYNGLLRLLIGFNLSLPSFAAPHIGLDMGFVHLCLDPYPTRAVLHAAFHSLEGPWNHSAPVLHPGVCRRESEFYQRAARRLVVPLPKVSHAHSLFTFEQ